MKSEKPKLLNMILENCLIFLEMHKKRPPPFKCEAAFFVLGAGIEPALL